MPGNPAEHCTCYVTYELTNGVFLHEPKFTIPHFGGQIFLQRIKYRRTEFAKVQKPSHFFRHFLLINIMFVCLLWEPNCQVFWGHIVLGAVHNTPPPKKYPLCMHPCEVAWTLIVWWIEGIR